MATRPRKPTGFTMWCHGRGDIEIERVWWQAKCLHFPKENITHWYDGSDLVGIEAWGFHGAWWTMKRTPSDWRPRPPGYAEEADRIWREWHTSQLTRSSTLFTHSEQ